VGNSIQRIVGHDESVRLLETHTALEQLQTRFIRAMNENAEMSVRQEQLEHLVTQLQTETDTVGMFLYKLDCCM
jgi:hypothetical protein